MLSVIQAQTSRAVMEQLEDLFGFPSPIVDVTWGKGAFWRSNRKDVIGLDAYSDKPQIRAEWTHLPFRDASIGTLVFDPPFLPPPGPNSNWLARGYGAGTAVWENKKGFSQEWLDGFFTEASRVLSPRGLLITKTGDMIHWHKAYWLTLQAWQSATDVGFKLYDWVVAHRAAPLSDPRWKNAFHTRKHHAHYMVYIPAGAPDERRVNDRI